METAVLTSVVAGCSALLGVALTSIIQARTQHSNQLFQLTLEASKREIDIQENDRARALERMAKAHRQLSVIGREFSLTTLDVIWRARMRDSEYDQRYLSICQEIDELRVIAGLYETTLSDDVEKLYGGMNRFWGNFKNVLYLTEQGKVVDHTTPCFQHAHAAAADIEEQVLALKSRLAELSHRCRAKSYPATRLDPREELCR